MTRTPLVTLFLSVLGALLIAPAASAQDVIVARPGTPTTTVPKPGAAGTTTAITTGIQLKPGTIQAPQPGTVLVAPQPGTINIARPGGGTTTTTALPGPSGTLMLPDGTVIKRLDVPPLVTGTPAVDLRTPNPNLRVIDPALLVPTNVPPVPTTPAQIVVSPVAVVSGRRGDALARDLVVTDANPAAQALQPQPSQQTGFVDVFTPSTEPPVQADVQRAANPLVATPAGVPAPRATRFTPRPDNAPAFSVKDGMHIYSLTPLDGKAAEQSRVQGTVPSLSTYINQRNAAAAMDAADGCQASPDDGNLRDRLCTHKEGLPIPDPPRAGRAGGGGDPPNAPPAPNTSRAEDYWRRSLEGATSELDKASSDLRGAERDTQQAEDDLLRAKDEVGRLTELVNYWDPKKADPKIDGHVFETDRLDGPDNTKQPGGTIRKKDSYTRLKTKAETERDLEQAKKDRDGAEAKVRGARAREGVFRQRRDDAARGKQWAEEKLDQAKAGDPAGNPPGPNGPVIVR